MIAVCSVAIRKTYVKNLLIEAIYSIYRLIRPFLDCPQRSLSSCFSINRMLNWLSQKRDSLQFDNSPTNYC
jgi:hypothetical protein